MIGRLTLAAALPVLVGCDSPARPAAARGSDRAASTPALAASPARVLQVALVDSVPYATDLSSGVLRRVAVQSASGVDTIPGVLTAVPAVAVGDTVVYGLRARDESALGVFRYDVRTHRVMDLPRPAGWVATSTPAIAPDGAHVAYLGMETPGRNYGAVARVLDARVIYRGPTVASRETDAGVDEVRWDGATRFEIRIDLPSETHGRHRIRGSVEPVHAVIDTVPDPAAASVGAPEG